MKRKKLFYGLLFIFTLLLASARNGATDTFVSGSILSDTTWTLAESPYVVTGSVLVTNGVTLTIEPGVEVRFDGAYRLQVEGQLVAIGTANESIKFTSNFTTQQAGDWIGIIFTDSSVDAKFKGNGNYKNGSTIQFSEITYGGTVLAYNCSPFINNNRFTYNLPVANPYPGYYPWDSAVLTYYGSNNPLITCNIINNNEGSAIKLEHNNVSPLIANNIIYNNYTYPGWAAGITDLGSNAIIRNNIIINNLGFRYPGGLFIGGGSPEIRYNAFINNTSSAGYDQHGGAIGSGSDTFIIQQNTIVKTRGNSTIHFDRIGTGMVLTQNNIINNATTYDIYVRSSALSDPYTPPIDATSNYWATTDSAEVTSRIFNPIDEFGRELVAINPLASLPISEAPMIPPIGLIATPDSSEINLNWSANPEADTAGYKVYWDTDSGYPYSNVVNVGNVTSYTLPGRSPGTYYVTVTAYDVNYNSANDDPATIVNENQTNGNESWYAVEEEINPIPDIKANSSDGLVEITVGDTLSVTIDLDPAIYNGYQADWWCVAGTPFGWYYYGSLETWLPEFQVSYQGPLSEMSPPREILNTSGLPTGYYLFYFGVDLNRNGNADQPVYFDSVVVNVTQP